MIPKGFEELIKLSMREKPERPKSRGEIWDRFLYIVFMGGRRGEPDINFLLRMLRPYTGLDYVLKTDGEDWREAVEKAVKERMSRIKDEDTQAMLADFLKELFRISASIKGGARFFQRTEMEMKFLESRLATREKAWEFIEELTNDEDVSNIRYTKIIIWLQSMGLAEEFCAPSWQTKSFVNEVYGYYQFYDDDKYFMKKAGEFAAEVRKKVRDATVRDVGMAIYYYTSLKSMLPQRSPEKKKFTPALLVRFLKSKKLTLRAVSGKLSEYDSREALMESLYAYLRKGQ